ncbi:MAG TPA: hypothetical protein VNQ79_13855 [Blastocatellia bacterium]|nr:hypothetical protein [Blastocatellia bacterium]
MPLFGAGTTDFHQASNQKNAPHDVDWIGGILNRNNSKYYEGMSTLQRLIYTGITTTSGNVHTLTFSHNAQKGSAHAYDYLTSWKQAVDAANAIAPGQDLLTNINTCGTAISASGAAACSALHTVGPLDPPNGTTVIDVTAPDNMGTLMGDNVAASVSGYETRFGNRTIRIYGNQNITAASLTFDGYVADDATYTLTWTSASSQIIIEFAAHIAQGTDTLSAGIGYGAGKGASSINGGPYHVHLGNFDGSGGNLDNQIQGSDVCDVALSAAVTNVSCFGGSNGAISLTVTGGTSPVTFLWNDGNTSQNRTGLTAGTYSVTATDKNGCTASLSNVVVGQPASALAPTATATSVSCNGGNDGAISISVIGGTPAYSFLWNDGNTSQNRTGLAAGTYSVTVTDSKGCTAAVNGIVVGQPAGIAVTPTVTNVSCNGGNDGAITLSVTGGTSPYSFLWSDGSTDQNRTGLMAGTYSVTVTDKNGCTKSLNGISISQPNALALSETHKDVKCNGGSDGSIDLTVSGGTEPYTYSWSNGATTQDLSGLATGSYSVTVTDANGCTKSLNDIPIAEPAALALSEKHTDVKCNGGSDGSIDLTVSGGTEPYSYSWSNGATTQDLNSIPAGTYNVTVTDANGCMKSLNGITIGQPAALALSDSHLNVKCNGGSDGSIDLMVTGGTEPYGYAWSNGATTEDLSGLAAGEYTVTVTDKNGCTAMHKVTIKQPDALVAEAKQVNVSCHGGSNGSIDLTVSGGTPEYSFAWSDGATTEDRSGLAAGTYSVTVTDANGCTTQKSVTITQPDALSLSEKHKDVKCNGGSDGSIDLTVSGGTAPYKYSWSNGATTEDLSGIPAGTYSVTVTDANECTAKLENVQITEPPALALSETHKDVKCNGDSSGSIDLTVTGGSGKYTYKWSNGATTEDLSGIPAGTYSVTVTDENECTKSLENIQIKQPDPLDPKVAADGPTTFCKGGKVVLTADSGFASYQWCKDGADIEGATSASYTATESGDYNVKVTNADGCKGTSVKTTVRVNPLPEIKVSDDQKLTCTVAKVKLSSDAGNIAKPKFEWTTADGHFVDGTDTSSNMVEVDKAGTYKVTVTDTETGCSDSKQVKVTEDKTPPDADAGADVTLDCLTGQATLKGTSKTEKAQFHWETSDGHIVSGADSDSPVVDKPGTYKLTVTNPANGCTATDTVQVKPCLTEFCSLTQGAYGNAGGKYWYNGKQWGTLPLIKELLTPKPLEVGIKGIRSLTIPLASAQCIINRLPSGGPAAALPSFGDAMLDSTSCQTAPTQLPVDSKGKWRNILLGQTVTLSLNVRLDTKLGGVKLCSTTLTTQKVKDGGDGIIGINPATGKSDDIPDPGPDGVYGPNPANLDPNGNPINDDPLLTVTIPQSVLNALSTKDVDGLLALANRALAGKLTASDPSLSDINAAVDAINRAFDECRFLISPLDCP